MGTTRADEKYCNIQNKVRDIARHADTTNRSLNPLDLVQASDLLAKLTQWQSPCESSPLHARSQSGDLSYKYALQILVLRDIFQVPHHHSQVSGAIDAIIEIGQELLASSARVLWLTWPMRTACMHMPPNDPRVNTARAIIAEYA